MILIPVPLAERVKGLHKVAIYYKGGRRIAIQYIVNREELKRLKEIFKNLMKEV